jgi:hypothetical protein
MRKKRSEFKLLDGNSTRKILLGKPRHRWKYDIKIDLKDLEWKGGFAWLRIGSRGWRGKPGNESSDSINAVKFLE